MLSLLNARALMGASSAPAAKTSSSSMNGPRFSRMSLAMIAVWIMCLSIHQSDAAIGTIQTVAHELLHINSASEWTIKTAVLTVSYVAVYLMGGSFFEFTNPKAKTPNRMASIRREVEMGLVALTGIVMYVTLWLWLIDPLLWTYDWYETHEFTWIDMIRDGAIYMFWMDTWFYWTHRMLHLPFWMKYVHCYHHAFINPSAFAQDATHPFETILQGPMGHHFVFVLWHVHPLVASFIGFCTSLYAIAAHDGRIFDLNDHCKHHHFGNVNFGLYWGIWDFICGTRFNRNDPQVCSRRGQLIEKTQYLDVYTWEQFFAYTKEHKLDGDDITPGESAATKPEPAGNVTRRAAAKK